MKEKTPTFGRYLMTRRLERGIRLGDVSKATRIGVDMLQSIENEAYDQLPAEVFVKGFLRSYAKEIGADGEKAVLLYTQALGVQNTASRFEKEYVKSKKRFWLRLFFSLALLFGLIGASLMVYYLLLEESIAPNIGKISDARQEKPVESGQAPAVLPKEKVPGKSTDKAALAPPVRKSQGSMGKQTADNGVSKTEAPGSPKTLISPKESREHKLVLKILAVDETWIKIIVDVDAPQEYSMKPSEQLVLEAVKGFNLLIGNGAGIRLFLNGKPVPIQGKKGQVVTMQIP